MNSKELANAEKREINKKFLWKLGYSSVDEFARNKGYDSAEEMANEFNYNNVRDFLLSYKSHEIEEMQKLIVTMDVFGDRIMKFNKFVARHAPRFGSMSYAERLFGDRLKKVIENDLEFFRQYQPTKPLCSVSGSEDYVEEHKRDGRYIVTDISEEGKRIFGLPKNSDLKYHKIEEKIEYTPEIMLQDIEYNSKIAAILANLVGSRGVYEIGAGNGVLALGLSMLVPNKVVSIESNARFVELQRKLHLGLEDKIKGELIIEEPATFSDYAKNVKINPDSFLVCNRGNWKLFDEVVEFGINNDLDMFVSRDFHSQQHMLGPVKSAPLEAYKHVKEIIFKITNNSIGHQIIMTRKDLSDNDNEDNYSHFNEFLIQRKT